MERVERRRTRAQTLRLPLEYEAQAVLRACLIPIVGPVEPPNLLSDLLGACGLNFQPVEQQPLSLAVKFQWRDSPTTVF